MPLLSHLRADQIRCLKNRLYRCYLISQCRSCRSYNHLVQPRQSWQRSFHRIQHHYPFQDKSPWDSLCTGCFQSLYMRNSQYGRNRTSSRCRWRQNRCLPECSKYIIRMGNLGCKHHQNHSRHHCHKPGISNSHLCLQLQRHNHRFQYCCIHWRSL